MYSPPHFAEGRLDVLHDAIRAHPLGLMITAGTGGLMANPLPFWLDTTSERGTLLGHLARANTQLPDLAAPAETLVVFQGPQAYVSPSWYPSKVEHGKVVPTWDYVIVQARGRARIVDDKAWLRRQLDLLTSQHEAGRPAPWKPEHAPAGYIHALMNAIVGLEIVIDRIDGKWKVSQNRSQADQQGVAAGLGDHAIADLIKDRLA